MSSIFRPPYRWPVPAQSGFLALTRAAAGGAAVQPAAFTNSASFGLASVRRAAGAQALASGDQYHGPSLRLRVAAAAYGNAASIHAAATHLRLTSQAFANESAFAQATVRGPVRASLYANGQGFHVPALRLAVTASSLSNSVSFFGAAALRGVNAPAIASGAVIHGPRLRLRLVAGAWTNAHAFHGADVVRPGIIVAPHVSASGTVFVPRITEPGFTQVVGTIGVAGWTPRPLARRPRVASWPNLPKVEAAPWRLVVVTPEIARERARALLLARKRLQGKRRTHDLDERIEAGFDEIIDDAVARTVVHLLREEA